MKKKLISIFMIVTMLLPLLTACKSIANEDTYSKSLYKDFIVVDVFDSLANFQGIQSGWFAHIVKEKFNMELNIIAPNVSGDGENLFEIRAASGNVGDIIISTTEGGKLQDMVDAGLVLDMSSMLKNKDIMRYTAAINSLNEKLPMEGIYAIPSEISTLQPSMPSEGLEPTFGPYLRWDLYSSIGYPKMSTLEDLLPVLEKMQEIYPLTENGKPTYAFSFFKDWDANLMNAVKQPACFYGYDEIGFVLAKADGTDYQSIIDSDSIYVRILKLYFEANQKGLIDPDSSTQHYEDVFKKYQEGAILYCPWPWLAQSAFNTIANKDKGKGYMLAPIDDMQIFSYGCHMEGNQKSVISIGSQAEDPQRLADFIDWLYSPEGIAIACAGPNSATAGPKGLTWEMGEEGPYLTEFGKKAFFGNNTVVPDEWGGGIWEEGVSQLNFRTVSQSDVDPDGYPYYYTLWDSVLAMEDSPLDLDWREYMKGSTSTMDYLESNNKLLVAPGSSFVYPEMSSEINTMRSQCRTVIVDYSWKMVFAEDEQSFYNLLDTMQKKVYAFGYDEVIAEDFKYAKLQDAARKEAASLNK